MQRWKNTWIVKTWKINAWIWYVKCDSSVSTRWHNSHIVVIATVRLGSSRSANGKETPTSLPIVLPPTRCYTTITIFYLQTPYINRSCLAIPDTFSLHRTYIIFRTLGLRHLPVVNIRNRVVGIITRYIQRHYLEYSDLAASFQRPQLL